MTARQAYTMLENETLWETAAECHRLLAAAEIPHAVAGGVAVCLHGYQRNTVDLDLLVRKEDAERVRETLLLADYRWDAANAEFRTTSGICVQFLTAGDRAGAGSEVRLCDPADRRAVTTIEGLPVLSLAKLIETKLASGEGSPRRTHKDFADVVELVDLHNLNSSFARHLHKSLRTTFRTLVRSARGKA